MGKKRKFEKGQRVILSRVLCEQFRGLRGVVKYPRCRDGSVSVSLAPGDHPYIRHGGQYVASPENLDPEEAPKCRTLAEHAEAWAREHGETVPPRDSEDWRKLYERWHAYAFADL